MKRVIKKILGKAPELSLERKLSTSLSDNQLYPHFCLQASNDLRIFNTFRRNFVYNEILEHASEEQGKAYLEQITKCPDILKKIDKFKANDLFENPEIFEYQYTGKISPTTLRYIKVLSDLKNLFGNLDGFNICEIGVGYGGQCRVINCYFNPNT